MENDFTIEQVCTFWDKVAPIYGPSNKKVGYVHYQRFEKAIALSDIKPGHTILNIWSRTGNFIPYVRKMSDIHLYNREVSPEMIKIAQKKYPNENFALTDLTNLSEFAENTFDRVISLETLEHTPKPPIFLKELYRILKPGGILILSLPPRGFEIPTRIWDFYCTNHGEGPHQFLRPSEVIALLKTANFKEISHEPSLLLPLGNDKAERMSEKILTFLFGKTPLANFSVRYFYKCKK